MDTENTFNQEIDDLDNPEQYIEESSQQALEDNAEPNSSKCDKTKPIEKQQPNETKTHLPLSRIKHIMKLDSDTTVVSLESVFVITKATELFVQSLAREAFVHTQQSERKTIQKKDLDAAISTVDSLIFLEDTLS